jgi:iron complex transport system permease protein
VVLAVAVVGSVFWGRYPSVGFTAPGRLVDDELTRQRVLTLRVPRVLTAAALGASLAAAGTVFQQIFANPLVEPGFLGVSQGAAFGACLAIVVFDSTG